MRNGFLYKGHYILLSSLIIDKPHWISIYFYKNYFITQCAYCV
nr:hypothetical protein BAR15_160022 [Bartonella sp. AR 15-3]